jgi:hypothetical protein
MFEFQSSTNYLEKASMEMCRRQFTTTAVYYYWHKLDASSSCMRARDGC